MLSHIVLLTKIHGIIWMFPCRYLCRFIVLCRFTTCLSSIHQFLLLTFLPCFALLLSKDISGAPCSKITTLFHCHCLQNCSLQVQCLFNKFHEVGSKDLPQTLKQSWTFVDEYFLLIQKIQPCKKCLQRRLSVKEKVAFQCMVFE